MKDRALHEEFGGGTLAVRRQQPVEVAQGLQILAPLSLDDGARLRQAGGHDDDELHEELVLEPRSRDRRLDPALERGAALLGELVDALAATVAGNAVTDDQAIAFEPRERRVDLSRVQRRQQVSELLLQRLPELVPVAALTSQKCKEVLSHR